MKLYRTGNGPYLEHDGSYHRVPEHSWDALVTHGGLHGYLQSILRHSKPVADLLPGNILAPIGNQEVWAAGVTYYRSRSARMEESKSAGGGDFYDRVCITRRGLSCSSNRRRIGWWVRRRKWRFATMLRGLCRSRS